MNIDRDWEREAEKVRATLPSGVKARVRVITRRVEAVPGDPWFEVFVASGDVSGCEISSDMEIKAGDMLELAFPAVGPKPASNIQGKVEWVRKNAMPILGRYSCRVNTEPDKDKKGRIGK